jgi:sarcosine oxidase
MTYDAIVIGLGGAGSAAAAQLARRGQKVLGLERFTRAHDQGSSHGQTRVIRQAYFEHPNYVPLLTRAYELWKDLEQATGHNVLTLTGGLMMGLPDSAVVAGSLKSAQQFNLPHEILDATEIRRRYPAFRPHPDEIALFEAKGGFLRPEVGVEAHLQLAEQHGASLHFEEPVERWEVTRRRVKVFTAYNTYEAAKLVIAPGAWAPELLSDLKLPLKIERLVLYWFAPKANNAHFELGNFPIFIWQLDDMPETYQLYGFPFSHESPKGVKVAFFRTHDAPLVHAAEIDREVYPHEIEQMRSYLERPLPDANGMFQSAKTCLYTTTPDEHFSIGLHPNHPNVVIASPCSGHGYKFVSVMGEILADLAIEGNTRHDISLFDLGRFCA